MTYLADPPKDRIRAALIVSSARFARDLRSGYTSSKIVALVLRDGDSCRLCGLPIYHEEDPAWSPSVDHVVPRSHEGPNVLENMRLAHTRCNNEMKTAGCPACAAGSCKGLSRAYAQGGKLPAVA